jgi:hypothetical protein
MLYSERVATLYDKRNDMDTQLTERIVFRASKADTELLSLIARRLDRSESDAGRRAIRLLAQHLNIDMAKPPAGQAEGDRVAT